MENAEEAKRADLMSRIAKETANERRDEEEGKL